MKTDIHPNYGSIKATCSCGNVIETKSTLGKDILIEVCSECHPFYTGKAQFVDTAGRIDKFRQKYGKFNKENKVNEENKDNKEA